MSTGRGGQRALETPKVDFVERVLSVFTLWRDWGHPTTEEPQENQ